MEFLVNIAVNIPHDVPDTKRADLFKAEAQRAKELADKGTLIRLWRIPGRRENCGLWRAGDASELHAALASLPMFPYLDINVTALGAHPSDPAAAS